jgi:hypothetical protein
MGSGSGLDADLLDGYHASSLLKDITVNYGSTITSANNYPTDLLSGIHRTHISNVEYASILTGYDYAGKYWQLRFRPSYNRNIYYRNNASTAWSTIAFTDSDITGNAATATKLQTARNINGTSFNGTANITTANWGTARNIGIVNSDGTGTAVTTSVNGSANINLKLPSTIKATLTGNASSATYASAVTLTADNTTNATRYPLFASAATGNLSPRTDTGFTYNPSTGALSATSFIGSLTGNASSATTATTATKVSNKLILKFDTGTTENTNLYTYDGSAAKTINITAGSNVSLTKSANTITINATDTTYSAGTKELILSGTNTTNRV